MWNVRQYHFKTEKLFSFLFTTCSLSSNSIRIFFTLSSKCIICTLVDIIHTWIAHWQTDFAFIQSGTKSLELKHSWSELHQTVVLVYCHQYRLCHVEPNRSVFRFRNHINIQSNAAPYSTALDSLGLEWLPVQDLLLSWRRYPCLHVQ